MTSEKTLTPDLCVIGAGSAGLSVAAGAVQMGARVVLIEKGLMGGDCLNTGCVPSKALLAAAHHAESIQDSSGLGIRAESKVDFGAVHRHVHEVIAAIAPHDSVERFEKLGVTVIQSSARFISNNSLEAGGNVIRPRRFIIATGSHAFIPHIEGLAGVPYFTNETIFNHAELPRHLVVLGGGPVGCEFAQAYRGLGAAVTLIEAARVLPKDDSHLVSVVRNRLKANGVKLHEGATAKSVKSVLGGVEIVIETQDRLEQVSGSHLLVAAGRAPSVSGLNLDKAGIDFTNKGIMVDSGLRTSNRRAYAIGDCIGGHQFTHVAAYQAGIVLRSALFRLPSKSHYHNVPWVTYTNPELAQVGLTEAAARDSYGDKVRILTSTFDENDRARAERKTDGLIKVATTSRGHILGAGIVGANAGELIQPWVLAMTNKLKISALATMIAPYPTLGEVNKRVAGTFYIPALYGKRARALVKFLSRFG